MKRTTYPCAVIAAVVSTAGCGSRTDLDDLAGPSVELEGGRNATPSFTDDGLTPTAASTLAGLADGDVLVTMSATGQPTSTCTDLWGANQPPGRNPPELVLTGSVSIPETAIENGTTPFRVTTEAPLSPIPGAPECPSPGWTETLTDVAFTSATITVEQPAGLVVLTVRCSLSRTPVTCTSS